ncbi:MocR-like transcription factor YczR [Auraticoccus monumenti]|uniref:DNA-binding transcriptional regulator, MocR family, contains an aminotransferase domain n=1 Tax=Auraticoccus monumenti TaxID=675864 RepID=A0A1G6ZKH8_9ACTN|nr:PLP-dependent aminotransferase family protein [Auraticoccus monumenti]SDE02932.1 DNA-binding transcriptional regulator, MocR family, contains an aminotransferase domain [Auraticoccus monumenti]
MQRTISATRVATLLGDGWTSPAYEHLAGRLRAAVDDGRIAAGARLPSERELTSRVDVSRTTVTRAYGLLREQGYLESRRGSGSVVRHPAVAGGRVDHLLSPSGGAEDDIDLTCTAPVAPPGVVDAYARALEQLGGYLPGTGYYPSGLPVLREALAARFTARGLPTDPDQVLVTSGALAGVAIAVRALLEAGDRVVVENPTYPNAIATLEGARARAVAHPVHHREHGDEWDTGGLATLVRQVGARAAYLVPDFHNPTAALMDTDQRHRVATVLSRARVVPIVDESLVDLALDGQQVPVPLGRLVPDAVTVGSASKSFWGGLRIGWLRAPRARMADVAASRLRLDLGAPVLEQLVAVELLARAEELVAEQRRRLREGRDLLHAAVTAALPDWRVDVPTGGMALWCELPVPRSTALCVAAARHGLRLAAAPNFAVTGGLESWLRLPYSAPADQLAQVAPRLAPAWEEALADPSRRGGEPVAMIA